MLVITIFEHNRIKKQEKKKIIMKVIGKTFT